MTLMYGCKFPSKTPVWLLPKFRKFRKCSEKLAMYLIPRGFLVNEMFSKYLGYCIDYIDDIFNLTVMNYNC